jgi:integrase
MKNQKAKPLTPIYDENKKAWRLSVPASLAPDGKRQRLFFASEKLAKLEVERINGMAKRWGTAGRTIKASTSEDAARASELLNGYDVTLTQIAKHWLAHKAEEDASCTLRELFVEYRAEKAPNISTLYLRDIDKFFAPIVTTLGEEVVAHLKAKRLREVMVKAFPTKRQFANAYRTIKPAFNHAIRSEYATTNPLDRVVYTKPRKAATEALTLAKVKAVINSCGDFTDDKQMLKSYQLDCTSCLPAFCVMLFAGVRPEEITKLRWENIHLDDEVIVIDGEVSKVRSHRIIPIEKNLLQWLSDVPTNEQEGKITPLNWRIKYAAVRHASGIKTEQQDILRHTFASYHLAAFGDLSLLQSAMGHGTSEMILMHYKALIRKPDAIKFWSITPTGNEIELEATA